MPKSRSILRAVRRLFCCVWRIFKQIRRIVVLSEDYQPCFEDFLCCHHFRRLFVRSLVPISIIFAEKSAATTCSKIFAPLSKIFRDSRFTVQFVLGQFVLCMVRQFVLGTVRTGTVRTRDSSYWDNSYLQSAAAVLFMRHFVLRQFVLGQFVLRVERRLRLLGPILVALSRS